MEELISIKKDKEGKQAVDARELHFFLENKSKFSDWIKNRILKYGFTENVDFIVHKKMTQYNQIDSIDYYVSLDMGKELAMVERNEKGKQARKYFIECENKLKESFEVPKTLSSALRLAADQAEKIELLENEAETNKPKVLFADSVSTSKSTILVGELAKILKQNGINTGQNRLFKWLRENGYLIKREGSDYNMPTQRSMEQKLFKIKETAITHADGHTTVNKTVKVTGKGQVCFLNKFLAGRDEK